MDSLESFGPPGSLNPLGPLDSSIPLGLYLSIPFCRSKCTFCNFASSVYPASLYRQYADRLSAEIDHARQHVLRWGVALPREVDSVYLGGGTPSLLPPGQLRQLFAALHRQFAIAEAAEITLECAPGQLVDETLDAMVECGINRVSFGVQSFVDREAAVTGRLHSREIALRDLARVRSAGIARVNVDLIAGLPHQTAASWRESLSVLAGTGVEHASIYMLEVDEESRLGRELLAGGERYHAKAAPGDDLAADFYETAIAWLEEHGLRQYEISNFAHPGSESRHNLKYWRRQPYFGFGLDAHSMLRRRRGSASRFATLRFATEDVLEEYLGRAEPALSHSADGLRKPAAFLEPPPEPVPWELTRREELEEAWFLGLRLRTGVKWRALASEFGAESLEGFPAIVDELHQLDLLSEEEGAVRLTRRGMLFSNEVFARLLSVPQSRALVS